MIIVTNAGVITSEENFRAMNRNTSFPVPLRADCIEPYGYQVLTEVEPPTPSIFFRLEHGTPVQVEGVWTQVWINNPLPLADAQALLLSNLAAARYSAQVAPVVIDSVSVAADHTSLTMLNSAIQYLNASTTDTVNFKAASGWTVLTLAQLQACVSAINAQAQKAFNNEYVHTQNIKALTDTQSVSTYDITTGW